MSTYKNFNPGDYIKLNVGGKQFLTSYSTLTKYDSMLKTMITGEVPVTLDSDGYILVDRDGIYFNLILNFMRDSEVDLPNDEHALKLIIREADYYQFQVIQIDKHGYTKWKKALIDYIQGSQIIVDSKRESRTLAELCEIINCKKPIIVITYFGPMTPEHFLTIEIANKLNNLLISYPTVNVYYVQGPQPIPGAYRPDILDVFVNGSRIYSESISHINYPNKEIWWNIVKNKLTDAFNKA